MRRIVITVVVLAAAVIPGRVAWNWLAERPLVARLSTRWIAPEAPAVTGAQGDAEARAWRDLGARVRGRIIWSSNRGGNHDLYEVDLATGRVTQRTRHPHVDYFSRYSPDGRTIAFVRSRQPWVSFRDVNEWDLFILRDDGTEERLAERASHPTWTIDGLALTFLRDNVVMRVDVRTREEQVVYRGSSAPTEGDVSDPGIGPDGLIAFSLRGVSRARRGVGVVDPATGKYTRVSASPSACQIAWFPASRHVFWVESSGNGGTEIMHASEPGAPASTLIDLPGDISHEYFPRVTRDGHWLIWGATAEGHEHDRADYEVFAWRIGDPWDRAVRLTHSPSNDQWPDFWVD